MSQIKHSLQHIINALKNGVVPQYGVEYLCVGRDKQLQEIIRGFNLIKENSGVVKIVSGEYGSGKTFFLQRMKLEALRNNFIVSSIKINQGFRLNHLQHLYYNIMHNLSILEDSEMDTSFEDIFDKWITKLQDMPSNMASAEIEKILHALEKYNASFSRAITSYIRARINNDKELSATIASWLTGEENIPYHLKAKFDVIGKVDKINALDFLKAFIKLAKIVGYNGIVILVDELELVMNERVDIRCKAYENIRYIIDECTIGELNHIMFVFTATNDLLSDSEKGIMSYEALYQRLGNPVDKNNSALSDMRQPILRLPRLSDEDFMKITTNMYEIYKEVYNIKPSISIESIMNWALYMYKEVEPDMKEINLRKFVMKVIEVFDIIEQHPDNTLLKSELKKTEKNGAIVFKAQFKKSETVI
ncbi:MAG: ATP-binding protein [Clostridia bacterium]|nr:ATP-binding protein [Clostridia bacterium]